MAKLRKCNACHEVKELTEFAKDSSRPSGFRYKCKPCSSKASSKWAKDNKETRKDTVLKYQYGISLEQYNAILEIQEHKCLVCREDLVPGRQTHLDHRHSDEQVRGILCHSCNCTLGIAEENVNRLRMLANYIELTGVDKCQG